MGRWRPPAAQSSPYITQRGHDALSDEYHQLWRVRRPAVVKALAEAAAEGDRSENAEYIYRKKELREIDRRVRYLQTRLPKLKIAGDLPGSSGNVFFGAFVGLARTDTGADLIYQIVGADEVDVSLGRISIDAPLARALIGKSIGDTVCPPLDNAVEYEIISVRYNDSAEK